MEEKLKTKKQFWAPKHIAYVKGLPFTCKLEEVREFFAKCGNITSIKEQMDDSKKWTGGLYIRFENEAAMNNAISLHESVWTGMFYWNDHIAYYFISPRKLFL